MIRRLFTILSLSLAGIASAQEAADSFIPNYSAGGAYYSYNSEAQFDDIDGSFQMREAGVSLPIPILMEDRWMIFSGVRFRHNDLNLQGLSPATENIDLYRVQVPLNIWFRPDDKWSFWVRAEPGIHSDFEYISSDDFVFTTLALASYQWNPKFKTAIGAYFSRDLGEERLLPALGFIWEPNPHWKFSITAPRIYISHAPNEGSLFSLFAYPGGSTWNIRDDETGENFDLGYSNIRTGLSAEKALFGPFWGYLEGGYQFNQSVELDGGPEYDAEGSWFGSGGLRMRF